ncbi:MAG: GNAT family N-acetyltransferase [Anaerolineae bacterium]|jgi:GNAT superfamily N-acetyltransferase|nr:GNAT family N-acetyltransferase [Anaerolineae bacterium]
MSWLLRGKTEKITVRPAVPTDRPALALLLAHTWRRHGIMAVEEQVALLSNGLSVMAFAGDDAVAFMGLSPRSPAGVPPEYWVDMPLIAVASDRPAAGVLRRLCETAIDGLRRHSTTGLVCLANDAWLAENLPDAGFQAIDQVLSYARPNRGPLPDAPIVCGLRPAGSAEAETVLELNAAAFEPIWHYDDRTVLSWLLTADHAMLAEQSGQPLGFALTTLNSVSGYAQLIRVATHPAGQRRGIGRQLVIDALRYAWEVGATGLSLNTQASNTVSRHLYTALGFQPTGGALSVLTHRLQ